MAHTNAGVVKLHDVSDFIAPAQACVVELGGAPAGAPTAVS